MIRDKWVKHYIKQYKSNKLTLRQFWDCIVDLKKNFDIESRLEK